VDSVFFVPITKVDVEKREVWGRAVQEVPDKSKEIFDYATSAPLFRDWSAGFDKATDGKSLGNIRAMHGKVAAGKVTAIDFNDTELAIDICAKVVDDAEWNKVQEGVYTGFSIGGSYEKRWDDGGLKRYTARPAEISLVDNPCVPTARFQMIKADGQVEEKEFKAPAAPAPDPAAETGGSAAPKTDPAVEPAQVRKSLYSVQMLASLMSAIAGMVSDAKFEAAIEGDNSPVPAQLRGWLASGLQILNAMTAEESAELLTSLELADVGDLQKLAGRPVFKVEVSGLSEMKEILVKGAADLSKMTAERDELQKKVAKLEAEPAPAKGVARVVDKAADSVLTEKKDEPEDTSPLGLMKKAQSNPTLIKI
jgi:hypothetical protein